jgi:hypothetical protein
MDNEENRIVIIRLVHLAWTAKLVGITQLETIPLPPIIHPLAMLAVDLLPSTHAELDNPHDNGNEHQSRSSPRKRQKLAAPIRLDTNLVAMLINNARPLDDHSRDKRTGESNSQKRDKPQPKVDASRQSPLRAHGDGRRRERKEHGGNGDAVQHKRRGHEHIDGLDALLDVTGPVEVVEGDGDARLVQGVLQDLGGVEAVHCAAAAALCDDLVDGAGSDGGVCDVGGRVAAAAVVEQVGRVPVVDAELVGDVADGVVDGAVDGVGDLVEVVQDGVLGAVGFVEEGLAQA